MNAGTLIAPILALLALASPVLAQEAGDAARADAGVPVGGETVEGETGVTDDAPAGEEADTEAAEGEGEATEAPAAVPTATGLVGELASETRVVLQRARPLFRASGDVVAIQRELPDAEHEVARLRDPVRMAPIARLSQREIADLRQQWRSRGDAYEAWQATLGERATELEAVRNDLVRLRRSWRELRDRALETGVSEARLQRILGSLDALREADDAVDARLEEVLALQERVSELALAAEDMMDQLRTAAAAYRERLFVQDRPALWVGLADPAATPEERTEGERMATSLATIGRLRGGLTQLATVFAVLGIAVVALFRRARGWPDGEPSRVLPRTVASRPIATALLLTLLATPLVMPHAPIVLYDVVFLLLLAPLARVLWPFAPPRSRALLLAALAFLLVNRVEAMGSEDAVLGRVLLLVESTFAIAVAVWWLARERGRDDASVRLRTAVVVVALPSALALVANLLGYVFLAKTLMRGTGFALSTGLSILAVLLLAEALVDLVMHGAAASHLRTVRDHGALMRRRIVGAASWVAALAWIASAIAGYGLLNPLENWLEDVLERRWEVGTVNVGLGDVAVALAILGTTIVIARIVRFVLDVEILPRMRLEPGVDGAISGLTRYVLIAIGILLALAAVGIDASQLAIVAGALGVGVGFGLQGIVANVIAGFVLMLERPVRLNDFIEVGPLIGRVERIGLRSSTVRAADGAEVIVPNESLISREVVNWTLSDRRRRIQVRVGVAYGTDPHRTLEILQRVAAAQTGVLGTAAIEAQFETFGASSLDFVLQFWTEDFANGLALKSRVGLAVHDALKEAGIEIPFPQQDVHVKSLPAKEG